MSALLTADDEISRLALAIGEPARTRMLLALLDGHARTSTELAILAEVTASTASIHLNRLREQNLVRVAAQGRHRYYSLYSEEVARALESLGVLAGRKGRRFVPSTPEPLRHARTCYDHLAGTLSVVLHDHFLKNKWLRHDPAGSAGVYELTGEGERKLRAIAVDIDEARATRRKFAYGCLDWSERRPHLAGALGAVILQHWLARKWLTRDLNSRALFLTRVGVREMAKAFALDTESYLLK